MATAYISKTVMFDQRLYSKGHLVDRWFTLLVTRFGEHARDSAPVRTGVLRAGINTDVDRIGPRTLNGTIESTAPYSLFVLRGTTGPIMSNKAWAAGGDIEAAYRTLWGVWPRGGKFSRTGPGPRKQHRVPIKGYWMPVPKFKGSTAISYQFSVSGQEANNFLLKAWAATARQHSVLRGVSIPTFIARP